jgi:hypothetical protein
VLDLASRSSHFFQNIIAEAANLPGQQKARVESLNLPPDFVARLIAAMARRIDGMPGSLRFAFQLSKGVERQHAVDFRAREHAQVTEVGA